MKNNIFKHRSHITVSSEIKSVIIDIHSVSTPLSVFVLWTNSWLWWLGGSGWELYTEDLQGWLSYWDRFPDNLQCLSCIEGILYESSTMIRPSLNWLYLIPIQRLILFITHLGPSRIDPHSLYFLILQYQQLCSIVVCYWILAIITCLNLLLRRSLIACIITNWMYFIGNYLRLLRCHFNLPYMSIYGRVRSLKKNVTPMYEWWFQSE